MPSPLGDLWGLLLPKGTFHPSDSSWTVCEPVELSVQCRGCLASPDKSTALLWPQHTVRALPRIPTGSELTGPSRVHGTARKPGPRESKSWPSSHRRAVARRGPEPGLLASSSGLNHGTGFSQAISKSATTAGSSYVHFLQQGPWTTALQPNHKNRAPRVG